MLAALIKVYCQQVNCILQISTRYVLMSLIDTYHLISSSCAQQHSILRLSCGRENTGYEVLVTLRGRLSFSCINDSFDEARGIGTLKLLRTYNVAEYRVMTRSIDPSSHLLFPMRIHTSRLQYSMPPNRLRPFIAKINQSAHKNAYGKCISFWIQPATTSLESHLVDRMAYRSYRANQQHQTQLKPSGLIFAYMHVDPCRPRHENENEDEKQTEMDDFKAYDNSNNGHIQWTWTSNA